LGFIIGGVVVSPNGGSGTIAAENDIGWHGSPRANHFAEVGIHIVINALKKQGGLMTILWEQRVGFWVFSQLVPRVKESVKHIITGVNQDARTVGANRELRHGEILYVFC
jgi:hypothetical protein